MTFDQWMRRPVYLAQCATWQKAAELNLCSFGVRALPGRRDMYAQAARDMIALSVRMDRARRRHHENKGKDHEIYGNEH